MRIGYFGDGPWSHKALEYILSEPEFQVVFIVARYDTADPVLRDYAARLNIPFLIHLNVNSPEFIEVITSYSPDINVSMSFNQILKTNILKVAPCGFINCHAGALPFYRGRNILNWALINGEQSFGVTVHYIDEGIDTGDVILQRFADIEVKDDYSTLLDKAISLCADTLFDALQALRSGTVQPIKQSMIHPVGFYCGRRGLGDEAIDWDWSSERIYNFIRAITFPGPGARTFLAGKELVIWKAEMIDSAPTYIATPGEVVGRSSKGIIVKTGDTTLLITEVSDYPNSVGTPDRIVPNFTIGTRFEDKIAVEIRALGRKLAELERRQK